MNRRRFRSSSVRRGSRRGLTLLELILAVGLGLLLVSGIYSAIELSARRTTAGKAELERLQIARAILRRMELDLRATMFDADSAVTDSGTVTDEASASSISTSDGTASDEASADTTSTTIGTGEDDDETWTGSLGIRGNATELWIDLSYIRRELEFTPEGTTLGSDLKTVAYFLTSAESPVETDPDAVIVRTDADGVGLARSMGDRSVLRTLNASSGDSILPGPTELLAPEVNALKFRYFDGLAWYEEWDSSTAGALPRAVEISLSFESAAAPTGVLGVNAVNASTKQVRLVVAIPVSEPVLEEEL